MLKKRELEILNILNENNEVSLTYLMDYFSLSKRTLQYSINNINYYLNKNLKKEIKIKNNILIFEKIDNIDIFFNYLKMSKEDRILLIELYLIFKKFNIAKFSKMLDLSRNTIKSDMALIKNVKFDKIYYLNLDIKEIINKCICAYENLNLKEYIDEIFDKDLLEKISKFLQEISKDLKLNLNEEIYLKIKISIYCYIKFPSNKAYDINNYSKKISKVYFKYFNYENSFVDIVDLLIGNSIDSNLNALLDESFLIRKLIRNVSKDLNINLSNDTILYDFLLSHMKVSIYRLKNSIYLSNSMYQELILEKSYILDIIKKNISEIEKLFNINFTDSELSLISYHFKASIERTEVTHKKKVILICQFGYGTSRLLKYNLSEKFDVEILDVMPAYMLNEIDIEKLNVDYILSTINLDIDHIKISPILTQQDYNLLKSLGIKERKEKIDVDEFIFNIRNIKEEEISKFLLENYPQIFYISKNKSVILDNLSENKVIFKDKVSNWQEAIDLVSKPLIDLQSVNQSYIDNMKKLIEKLGSYIVVSNLIAMPHSKNNGDVNKDDFSMLILDEPVMIKNKEVRFFFCFCAKDKNSQLNLLHDFYNLISNESFIKNISKIKSYNKLYEFLKWREDV